MRRARLRALAGLMAAVSVLPAAGLPGAPARAQDDGVTSADDGYHFDEWADGSHDGAYTEWWYFNFFDARLGVQAIVSYLIINPDNLLGASRVQLAAVAYTPSGIVTAVDTYPRDAFSAAAGVADVSIASSAIRVIDADTYAVTGASRDGRLAWDLTWERRAAAPWLGGDRIPVGTLAWESMSWLVDMPRARVAGRFVIDGQEYAIDAPGYHDHNWGEWVPPHALWNWAQFADERVALEMGDFIGGPAGALAVDLDGTRTVFRKEEYSLVHTRWAWDRTNSVFYPTESLLFAKNDALRTQVLLRALKTEPLRGDLPFPLRDVIVYEQTARYDGLIWKRGADGRFVVAAYFGGPGFKEYTARHY